MPALPDETGEQSIEASGQREARRHVILLSVANRRGRLKGRVRFDTFSAGDGERACLVGPREPPGPFRDVAARALRSAESFVAELRVLDADGLDGNEELDRDVVRDEPMMGKLGR